MPTFQGTIRMQDDRGGVTHGGGRGIIANGYVVAGREHPIDQVAVEARFHPQVGVTRTPRAAKQPTRCIERFIEWLPKIDVAREDRCLALRLAVAAHRSVGDEAPILECGERWIQRVKWTAAGRECIQ